MGLKNDIDFLKNKYDEEEKEKQLKNNKKFRYPFGKKVGKSQRKKNFITLVKIHENGSIEFKKVQIKEQTFMEDGIPRLAAAGYVLHDKKGNPVVILPSWSVEPFSPIDHFQKSLTNGTNAKGFKLLMANMENEALKIKQPMGGILKWIIGFLVVGVIVYAIMTGGS